MDCPSPDQLVAFLAGELPEARVGELASSGSAGARSAPEGSAESIETHMDQCAECRAVLSNMARGGPPPSLGRYRIDTVLGSGGMGIVYRGFDPQLARPVAIKVVRRGSEDTAGRARLVREAQALARLSHPNVCHVYDVGQQEDEVWVAMELIEGVQLRQWAVEGHTRDEVLTALLGAAEGIAAAHAAGLVHRDIKPENVLVTRDGRPIVTDFGLARHEDAVDVNAATMASDPNLTATGAIAGTPAYLAPEQLLGDPLDARVDQFAWAVMAWELLTGSRPFPVVFAVRVEAIRAGLKPPMTLPTHIGNALVRALQATPSDRFGSMRELIEAMRTPTFTALPSESSIATDITAPAPKTDPAPNRTVALAGLSVLAATGLAVGAYLLKKRAPSTTQAAAPTPTSPSAPVPTPADAAVTVAIEPPVAPAPDSPVPSPPAPTPRPAASVPKTPHSAPVAGKQPPPTTATAPVTTTPAPPPPQQPQLTEREPRPPVVATPSPPQQGRYCRSCQVATVDAFCRIPVDFANPGTKSNFDVVDWGTVSKVEVETGSWQDEQIQETVITLRGQRRTYRFTADFMNTVVTTQVGALLAICPEDQTDLYRLNGGPTDKTQAVITLSAPPNTKLAAKLGAVHLPDIQLAATSGRKAFDTRVTADGTYLVHAKVYGIDHGMYRMDRYWMKVPANMKNEDKLEQNKYVWLVVGKGEFIDIDDKQMLLVHALAILDELFPQ